MRGGNAGRSFATTLALLALVVPSSGCPLSRVGFFQGKIDGDPWNSIKLKEEFPCQELCWNSGGVTRSDFVDK